MGLGRVMATYSSICAGHCRAGSGWRQAFWRGGILSELAWQCRASDNWSHSHRDGTKRVAKEDVGRRRKERIVMAVAGSPVAGPALSVLPARRRLGPCGSAGPLRRRPARIDTQSGQTVSSRLAVHTRRRSLGPQGAAGSAGRPTVRPAVSARRTARVISRLPRWSG